MPEFVPTAASVRHDLDLLLAHVPRDQVQALMTAEATIPGRQHLFFCSRQYTTCFWDDTLGDALAGTDFVVASQTPAGQARASINIAPQDRAVADAANRLLSYRFAKAAKGNVTALVFEGNSPQCFDFRDVTTSDGQFIE